MFNLIKHNRKFKKLEVFSRKTLKKQIIQFRIKNFKKQKIKKLVKQLQACKKKEY